MQQIFKNKTFKRASLLVLLFLCVGTSCLVWSVHHKTDIPKTILQAQTAIVRISVGEKKSSAIRISDNLILAAAHAFRGYDGKSTYQTATIQFQNNAIPLEIAEIGLFQPDQGNMQDWVLLKPTDNQKLPNGIGIAQIPTKKEMSDVLNNQGSFEKPRSGMPIWSVTFPGFSLRTFPRPSIRGKDIFLSKGYIKTDQAYKKSILFAALNAELYDESYNSVPPSFTVNIEKEWPKLEQNSLFKGIYLLYTYYNKNQSPLLYHTADYSSGSSGGGFFSERTGHLIGLVSIDTHLGPRQLAYYGIGSLYRMDKICEQTTILSEICHDFNVSKQ